MRTSDVRTAKTLEKKLKAFGKIHALPGIATKAGRQCLVEQLVDSIRRIKYVTAIRDRQVTPTCADPYNAGFNPLRAASWHKRQGNIDEACWLIFLSIHFGKAKKTGWDLVRDVYKGKGKNALWSWDNVSKNIGDFRKWLHVNEAVLRANNSFGNHRKYESLNAYRKSGTGEAIASYVAWIGAQRSHARMFGGVIAGLTPRGAFDALYQSMNKVARFGRMGKFDYLTMLGKFRLVAIEPGSTYMHGATGPYTGACLLFFGNKNAHTRRATLDNLLTALEKHLGLYFGMQVLEDAICNWQKSPNRYVHFTG